MDMCIDMRMNMRADMCIDKCMNMYANLCVHVQVCSGMGTEMRRGTVEMISTTGALKPKMLGAGKGNVVPSVVPGSPLDVGDSGRLELMDTSLHPDIDRSGETAMPSMACV